LARSLGQFGIRVQIVSNSVTMRTQMTIGVAWFEL